MKPHALLLLFTAAGAAAQTRSSACYTLEAEALAAGGAAGSLRYQMEHITGGESAARGGSATKSWRPGFGSSFYRSTGVSILPAAAAVNEESSVRVRAFEQDDTGVSREIHPLLTLCTGSSTCQPVSTGVIQLIAVDEDTPAQFALTYNGWQAQVTITVLDANPDNFGIYAGDGMNDLWQRQNFGPQSPRGLPLADPDGDGLLNAHEWYFSADPLTPDAWRLPVLEFAAGEWRLRFRLRPGVAADYLLLEESDGLSLWLPAFTLPWTTDAAGGTIVPAGPATGTRRFFRWIRP